MASKPRTTPITSFGTIPFFTVDGLNELRWKKTKATITMNEAVPKSTNVFVKVDNADIISRLLLKPLK